MHTCEHLVPFEVELCQTVVSEPESHQVLQSEHADVDFWHLKIVKDYPRQLSTVQHLVVHLLLSRVPYRCSSLQIAWHDSPKSGGNFHVQCRKILSKSGGGVDQVVVAPCLVDLVEP